MLGIIVGLLCTIIIIITAVTAYIILKNIFRNRYQFVADHDLTKPSCDVLDLMEVYDPKSCGRSSIPVESFLEHVTNLHADGEYLLSQEYEEINRLVPINVSTCQSSDDQNKLKNRYLNILAYDHSRVALKQLYGKPKQSDYINANFINGYLKTNAFIATQGPLPSTFGDFWRMVWEQNSAVIVMITNLTEKGRRKCDQYWPSEGEHQYDTFVVRLTNTSVTAHYTVRSFCLKHLKHKKFGSERAIIQFHYTEWPDHGVPTYTLPTLSFVVKSAATNCASTGPMIIHCSAGVGRTGTYIVIDSMINQIRDLQSVNVFDFLISIRNQRNYLVQTEDQYSFIHDVLLEYIQSGETEVKNKDLAEYLKNLEMTDEQCSQTKFEQQYKHVISFQPKSFHFVSALASFNESKNRSQQFLPVEMSRVYLPTKAGIEGSDYINASFLQGYRKNEEYIITQHPLAITIIDFWNMVWDQNSKAVILLCQVNEETDGVCFWPQQDESMDFENFHLSFRQEKLKSNYVIIEFILQSTQDDYECTVQMLRLDTCDSLIETDLVNIVKSWHKEGTDVSGPIIVIDRYGGVDAVKFCALSTLFDQMKYEHSVNVYAIAKLYHMKRPGVFPSLNDYSFLYKAVQEATVAGEIDSGITNCHSICATETMKASNSSSSHNGILYDSK